MEVYLLTNLVNGKQYVGKTVRTTDHRWARHVRAATRPPEKNEMAVTRALRKYQAENFQCNVLWIGEDYDLLNELERRFIAFFDTRSHHGHGYNGTAGGDGGLAPSPATLNKISQAVKAAHARPGAREQRSTSLKAAWARPGAKKKRSAAVRAARSTLAAKKACSLNSRRMWKRHGAKEKQAAAIQAIWDNPNSRQKWLIAVQRPGESNPSAKLTEQTVRDIRLASAMGSRQVDLAGKYGITRAALCKIVHRETWKHVV